MFGLVPQLFKKIQFSHLVKLKLTPVQDTCQAMKFLIFFKKIIFFKKF